MENYPVDNARLRQAGLSFQVADFQAQERTNYPLTLALRSGDTLELTFYDTVLFTEAQIARMGAHFVRGLQQLVMAGERRPLSTLTILTPAEETQLLQSWNDTHLSFEDERFIPQRVAAWAARQPAAPAVVQGERCLTYGELERRSQSTGPYSANHGYWLRGYGSCHLSAFTRIGVGGVGRDENGVAPMCRWMQRCPRSGCAICWKQ
ncbi:MAG: condensation domain-containing protein [Chloroflexi bacterium]|nr:condensation domain-containing protein [Chloroflexota bacterium]